MNAFEYLHPQYYRDSGMYYFHYIDSKKTFELYKKYFKYTGEDPKAYPLAICPRAGGFEFGSLEQLNPITLKLVNENPEKARKQTLEWIYERIDNFSKVRKFIRKTKEKFRSVG